MKRIIIGTFVVLFGFYGHAGLTSKQKQTIREINKKEPSWQKLAIDVGPFRGGKITLEGWLDYELGYAGGNRDTQLSLFESPWAMEHGLRARSVQMLSNEVEDALKNTELEASTVLRGLKAKVIRVTGICEDSIKSPYYIASLKGPLTVEVLRSQNTFGIPTGLLESE